MFISETPIVNKIKSKSNYILPTECMELLQERLDVVTLIAHQGMREMNIPSIISSMVCISCNMMTDNTIPNVQAMGDQIILEIPPLFLITQEDLQSLPIKKWISQQYQDPLLLEIFSKFIQHPTLANKAKKFVLYHELAHIFHKHIFQICRSYETSRQIEKEADLTAAFVSKEAEGGIYLFNLFSNYNYPSLPTHPSYQERAKYLQKFQNDLKLI